MKKKNLFKTLAILGIATTASVGLASCSTETGKVESITPLVNYDGLTTQSKMSDISTYASDVSIFNLYDAYRYNLKFDKMYFNTSEDINDFQSLFNQDGNLLSVFVSNNMSTKGDKFYIPIYSKELQRYIGGACFSRYGNNFSIYYDFFGLTHPDINTESKLISYMNEYVQDWSIYKSFLVDSSGNVISTGYNSFDDYDGEYKDQVLNLGTEISLNGASFDKVYILREDGGYVCKNNTNFINVKDISKFVYAGFSASGSYTDTDSPVLNIPALETNVNSPVTFTEIRQHITATDPTEGDISSRIEFIRNKYVLDSNGKIAPGEYTFTVRVVDNSGNATERDAIVYVKDYDAPTITATDITTSYTTTLTSAQINNLFTYSDNYYDNSVLTFSVDASEYTANAKKTGRYPIRATITDPSNNVSNATAYVTVEDKIKPTISFPKDFTISNTTPFVLDDLKAMISAYDEHDGTISFDLVDNNNMFPDNKIGSYTFTVTAKDAANNVATQTFTITVEDKDFPIIDFDMEYFFYVPKSQALTEETIVMMLLSNGQAEGTLEENNITNLKTTYFLSPHEEGEYDLYVELSDGSVFNDTIVVTSDESDVETNWFTDYFNNFKQLSTWGLAQYLTIATAGLLLVGAVLASRKRK